MKFICNIKAFKYLYHSFLLNIKDLLMKIENRKSKNNKKMIDFSYNYVFSNLNNLSINQFLVIFINNQIT